MVLKQLAKEQAKEEVKKLVDKYARIVESGSIKGYSENGTKKDFITPLFKALGWDVENEYSDDEVRNEEKVSKGRVDYSFRINGIPKFFLEAKALKEDLDNIKFVEQAINYAWHKGCTWAVLTDFEAIKIFNAEWKSANPLQAQFGQTLPCRLFLEKFDTLWLLSREGFEKKLLDTEAENWGKKIKKIPVDKQLLDDLTKFRDLLNKNILKNNSSKNLSGDELDEAVQRIIDRLIFIRTLEDKELEAPMLQSVVREDLNKRIYKKLNMIFRKIDDIYNSKLFTPHLCENLEIDDEVLSKIINGLFNTSDNTVHYDFSAIDADVLGNIYEQYLGHILKKTDKRAKLAEGKAHRKEQGIYYTPTYVVDYIVKNTIGELAKDKKFDLKNIKILDPACGSGSFLMKAFDYLVTLDKKKNGEMEQVKLDLTGESATYGRKVDILKNNIFGVDLDPKAVEIAQLNLLLKAAEKKHRLPTLQENIRIGNSLIDDSSVTGDKAFKWEEQFKEIIQYDENGNLKDGYGFDVVIGNPPYGAEITEVEKQHIKKRYIHDETGNTASLFIFKALDLLKDGGYFAFIVPKQLTYISSWESVRKTLLNLDLIKIIDASEAFPDVELEQIIFIVKKNKTKSKKMMLGFTNNNKIEEYFSNKEYLTEKRFPLWITNDNHTIFDKILNSSIPLSNIAKVNWGGPVAKFLSKEKTDDSIPCIRGREVQRYSINSEYFIKRKDIVDSYYIKGEKLLFQRIVSRCGKIIVANYRDARLNGTYCNDERYADKTVTQIWNSKIPLKYLLGILNSRLISWFAHRYLYNRSQLTMEFMYDYARSFPIRDISEKENNKIISSLVDRILSLKKRLNEIKDKQTDSKAQLEKEIQKIDNEIDGEVYKLYGITEEEKKIIEKSLKLE